MTSSEIISRARWHNLSIILNLEWTCPRVLPQPNPWGTFTIWNHLCVSRGIIKVTFKIWFRNKQETPSHWPRNRKTPHKKQWVAADVYYLCIVTLQITSTNLYPCTLTGYRYPLYIASLLLCKCIVLIFDYLDIFTLFDLVNTALTIFLQMHCWFSACDK